MKSKAFEEDGKAGGLGAEETFGETSSSSGRSLYEILGVEKTASQQEIKKAYYKLSLRLHPDKSPGAKEKFQQLEDVISILGDDKKRAVHDQTGYAGPDFAEADIDEFEASYRGSDS